MIWRLTCGPTFEAVRTSSFQVSAVRTARGVLPDVGDGDPRNGPEPAVGRDPALGGTGLRMVARLTLDRGRVVADDREHVWSDCPLAGGHEEHGSCRGAPAASLSPSCTSTRASSA